MPFNACLGRVRGRRPEQVALSRAGPAQGGASQSERYVLPKKTSLTGSELFIVDNSDEDWKAVRYLRDWCQLSKSIDIATGYFEIGALLALDAEWQKVDGIRLLIGDEVSRRTKKAFDEGFARMAGRLDESIEAEKKKRFPGRGGCNRRRGSHRQDPVPRVSEGQVPR